MIHRVSEGTESQIFKSKFVCWDDVIAVDFTRTAHSVQRTGADLQKWAKQQVRPLTHFTLFTFAKKIIDFGSRLESKLMTPGR